MYKEVERKIFFSDELLSKEYEYFFGLHKEDKNIIVSYYHPKTDLIHRIDETFTLKKAMAFARSRMKDKRYKNYEILIDIERK